MGQQDAHCLLKDTAGHWTSTTTHQYPAGSVDSCNTRWLCKCKAVRSVGVNMRKKGQRRQNLLAARAAWCAVSAARAHCHSSMGSANCPCCHRPAYAYTSCLAAFYPFMSDGNKYAGALCICEPCLRPNLVCGDYRACTSTSSACFPGH